MRTTQSNPLRKRRTPWILGAAAVLGIGLAAVSRFHLGGGSDSEQSPPPDRSPTAGKTSTTHFPFPETQGMQPAVAERFQSARARVEASPQSADAWGELGIVCDAHGAKPCALAAYRTAAELAPKDFRWPYLEAIVSENAGKPLETIVHLYTRALTLQPDYTPAHVRLGQAYLRSGRLEPAADSFRNALELDGTLAVAERGLGRVMLALDRAEEAVEHFRRALALFPDDGPTYAGLARALLRAGKNVEARQASDRSRDMEATAYLPDPVYHQVRKAQVNSEAAYLRALESEQKGEWKEAIRAFEQVAEARPRDPYSRIHLATCYLRLGKTDRAKEWYAAADRFRARLRATAPDTTGLAQTQRDLDGIFWLYHCLRMMEAVRAGDAAAVDDLLERFRIESEGSEPDLRAHLVWGNALMYRGRTREAVAHYRTALSLDPDNPHLLFNLGVALEQLGEQKEAIVLYRQAVRLDPDNRAALRLQQLGAAP